MGFLRGDALWPGGVIPYDLGSSAGNLSWRASVQAALLDWMAKTEITFVPRTTQTDYLQFIFDPNRNGCSAGGAGRWPGGGRQTLICRRNGTEPDAVSVYAHEIGHVIGFIHEHQRPDRDAYVNVDITAARAELDDAEAYEIVPAAGGDEVIGPYDCRSVNHYARNKYISPRPGGCAVIGSHAGGGASLGDIDATRHGYHHTPAAGLLDQQAGLSRGPNSLDIFVRWTDHKIHTATWSGEWKGWWRLDNPSSHATAIIERAGVGTSAPTAISTSPTTVDLFLRGVQDGVFTTSWTGSDWTPWERVGQGRTLSSIAATHRGQDVDLFIRGLNSGVYTAGRRLGKWTDWSRIGNHVSSSDVTATALDDDTVCVFAHGVDGGVYLTKWRRGVGWGSAQRVLDGVALLGSSVAAVQRAPGVIDLFIIGTNGGVYTAASHDAGNSWRGWWRVGTATALPGTTVAALSRNAENLEVFVVGSGRQVWTTTWTGAPPAGWAEWKPIFSQQMAPRTGLCALSRTPDRIDLFAVADDGRTLTAGWHAGIWKGWWPVEAQT